MGRYDNIPDEIEKQIARACTTKGRAVSERDVFNYLYTADDVALMSKKDIQRARARVKALINGDYITLGRRFKKLIMVKPNVDAYK